MQEKKNDAACEQEHKKISKRYLAFYVIGLFCVALVLILLSYLTQLRADRQLASMNSALAQKDTTVQGVQEKVVALQKTVEEQTAELDKSRADTKALREALKIEENADVVAAVQQQLDENDAYESLIRMEIGDQNDDASAVKAAITYLENTYGSGRLDGTAENAVFTGETATAYLQLKAQYQ